MHCVLVEDGQMAIETLEADTFDVAIVDMHMPVLSGIDAYKLYQFAHAGEARQVPFIMLTANATVEARAEAHAAGIGHFLTKPVSSMQLIATIAEATQTGTSGASAQMAGMAAPSLTPTEDPLDRTQLADLFAYVSTPEFGERLIGGFETDSQGRLTTKDGYLVDPGITVPQDATSVSVNQLGQVSATLPAQIQPQVLGQITMSRFINKVGLESIGDNLFLETPGSGPAIDGTPGAEGFGNLQQGYLEESNVNAVTEIAAMIQAQRAYELNSKVITGADQMLQATSNLFRG
jgi:flagellar basal body rod protein FlgG